MHWLDWPGLLACLLLLFGAARWTRGVLATPRLPPLDPERHPSARVSIVVAARDEGEHIEEAVRRLLGQRGVESELIVVDDRSTDETGAVLDRLGAEAPGLRVVHIDALPEGWLGKCHALWRGAQAATGEWLCFVDADVRLEADVLARAVALAERRAAAHVALIPRLSDASLAVRPSLAQAALGIYERAPAVNREPPSRRTYIGVGAFNLVRRSTYDAFGGHETLRLEVVDDLKLGLLVRRAGERTVLYDATREMFVPYITSVPRLFAVVEKNLFAMMRFSLVLTTGASALLTAIWGLTIAGPAIAWATGASVLWAGPVCLWSIAIPASLACRRQGWSVGWALLSPLALPLSAAAAMNSAIRATLRGAIVWRGTRYPLRTLRRGAVR